MGIVQSLPRKVSWTFLTEYALVLIQVWRWPNMTVRTIAERVRISEAEARHILAALLEEGYITRRRVGRSNRYFVRRGRRLRHPEVAHCEIDELLKILAPHGPHRAG